MGNKMLKAVPAAVIVSSFFTWAAPSYALRQTGLEESPRERKRLEVALLTGSPDQDFQNLRSAAAQAAANMGLLPPAVRPEPGPFDQAQGRLRAGLEEDWKPQVEERLRRCDAMLDQSGQLLKEAGIERTAIEVLLSAVRAALILDQHKPIDPFEVARQILWAREALPHLRNAQGRPWWSVQPQGQPFYYLTGELYIALQSMPPAGKTHWNHLAFLVDTISNYKVMAVIPVPSAQEAQRTSAIAVDHHLIPEIAFRGPVPLLSRSRPKRLQRARPASW